MKHGLSKELAILKLSPAHITQVTGINFEIVRDALDDCRAALLVTEDGQQFALRSYFRGPHPDLTEVIGDEKSNNPPADAQKFLDTLGFRKELVAWVISNAA